MNPSNRSSSISILSSYCLLGMFILLLFSCKQSIKDSKSEDPTYEYEVIADSLMIPWDIEIGPDGYLWSTDQVNKVIRINTESNEIIPLELKAFLRDTFYVFGLTFHPKFKETGLVFLSIMYPPFGRTNYTGYCDVISARYSPEQNTLTHASVIIDSLNTPLTSNPGGRMAITKDNKLLVIAACEKDTIASQLLDNYSGKVLRFNLDGTIPSDNPFVNSPIYSYGHRNPQGLIVLEDGAIYNSEHGPSTDDEFNEIIKGKNYGWPIHRGITDTEDEINFTDSVDVFDARFFWTPTIAPSSLLFYDSDRLPSLQNRFLVSTLKETDIRVLRMGVDSVYEERTILDGAFGRIRDMEVDSSGILYVSTANILPFSRRVYDGLPKDSLLYYDVIIKVYQEN